MKRTIAIVVIIALSIGIGFAYENIVTFIEKNTHPRKYSEYVEMYSKEYSVPQEIIYAVIKTESSFRSDAESTVGAVGLMQIMPTTFDWLLMKSGENIVLDLLYKPEINIKYGTYMLSLLYMQFNNWELVYAAYNAGPTRVKDEWMTNPEYIKDGEIIFIPIEETRNYIVKVKKSADVYKRLYF